MILFQIADISVLQNYSCTNQTK